MPTRVPSDPIAEHQAAIDRLLASIERSPSEPATIAFKAAIRRHGRELIDQGGLQALDAVVASVRAAAPDEAAADARERILALSWDSLITSRAGAPKAKFYQAGQGAADA